MDEVDTAEIRAKVPYGATNRYTTLALCDALDAAEAELAHEFGMRTAWQYRAKAAEAERDEYRLVVDHCTQVIADWEAAEARIAAAVSIYAGRAQREPWIGSGEILTEMVRALTGERRSIDDATPGEWDAANRRVTGAYGTNGGES